MDTVAEEMRNDGFNGRRDGRGNEDGSSRYEGTTETAMPEARKNKGP